MGRILLTGALGFIGRRLTRSLTEGHEMIGLVRRSPENAAGMGVQLCVQDLRGPLSYSRLPKRLDAIIHLAQSRQYKKFPDEAEDIFEVNVHGTFRLLEYARKIGVECFILASSGGIYGYGYEKLVETDPANPLNFYLSSKYTAELLLANYRSYFRTVVLRLFFAYGSGQRDMLIPGLLQRVTTGDSITIEGEPGLRINPVHVSDAVSAFEAALRLRDSDVFNVAGDEVVTITDLVRLMEKVSGREAVIRYAMSKISGDLVGDNRRMKEVLGVYPKTVLLEGLQEMVRDTEAAE